MFDSILVINAGSSSVKFKIYKTDGVSELNLLCRGGVSGIGTEKPKFKVLDARKNVIHKVTVEPASDCDTLAEAQELVRNWLPNILEKMPLAIGHRVVHGGPDFFHSTLVTDENLKKLDSYVSLAPLHQANNLLPVHMICEKYPNLTQIVCFDTAFHRSRPLVAERFALPESLYKKGVRRYGFHGLSYEYISEYLEENMPEMYEKNVVVCHLGSGASLCAIRAGVSIDSTMGFTALDGLPMNSRCGSLDSGVVLWMLEQGMDHDEIEHVLYYESGLKGLSGSTGDMGLLEQSKDLKAKFAIEYFCYQVATRIAQLACALGGLDGLVFTAGIGENSPLVRQKVCAMLAWMGVYIDEAKNQSNQLIIDDESQSETRVMVIPTNEELVIAVRTLKIYAARQKQLNAANAVAA